MPLNHHPSSLSLSLDRSPRSVHLLPPGDATSCSHRSQIGGYVCSAHPHTPTQRVAPFVAVHVFFGFVGKCACKNLMSSCLTFSLSLPPREALQELTKGIDSEKGKSTGEALAAREASAAADAVRQVRTCSSLAGPRGSSRRRLAGSCRLSLGPAGRYRRISGDRRVFDGQAGLLCCWSWGG